MVENKKIRVAILHPDLGIGGAEQLIINLALSCKKLGHYVKIFTSSYDPTRAFSQTKDGTIDVEVRGNCFPRRILGRCHALCEYVRMLFAAIYLILFGGHFDLVIIDQIPLPIPLLNIRFKTFFYCHFPDKLLCVERTSAFKRFYRLVIDSLEELTMYFAHSIVVNSKFTSNIFKENFSFISKRRELPGVIYPCIELSDYDKTNFSKEDLLRVKGLEGLNRDKLNETKVIVSLNRYERKKNLELAVDSFISYMEKLSSKERDNNILIIAGGYDTSLRENVEVLNSLKSKDFKLCSNQVFFLQNISNEERSIILKTANIVIYTPKNEHFGIVPVESMYCGAWVIAHKSGGPTESVKENETGNLLDNDIPSKWAEKIEQFLNNKENFEKTNGINKAELKKKQRDYILDNFSLTTMVKELDDIIKRLIN
jgi:alpha-1,3/alpha-1,6-mannosyltransferase